MGSMFRVIRVCVFAAQSSVELIYLHILELYCPASMKHILDLYCPVSLKHILELYCPMSLKHILELYCPVPR